MNRTKRILLVCAAAAFAAALALGCAAADVPHWAGRAAIPHDSMGIASASVRAVTGDGTSDMNDFSTSGENMSGGDGRIDETSGGTLGDTAGTSAGTSAAGTSSAMSGEGTETAETSSGASGGMGVFGTILAIIIAVAIIALLIALIPRKKST